MEKKGKGGKPQFPALTDSHGVSTLTMAHIELPQ